MAYTQVGIVNITLIRAKCPVISAMTDQVEAARVASSVWDHVRNLVLSEHHWNFAKRRAELAKDTETPAYGPDYRYAKPANCLAIVEVVDENDVPVEYVEEGDYILTDADNDEASIYMRYITIITDYTKWTPTFVDAFSYRLAAEMGAKLQSIDVNDMLAKYAIALANARGHDQMQDSRREDRQEMRPFWTTAGRR